MFKKKNTNQKTNLKNLLERNVIFFKSRNRSQTYLILLFSRI